MSEVSQPNLIETIEKALAQAKKGGYHVGVIADEWLRALLEERSTHAPHGRNYTNEQYVNLRTNLGQEREEHQQTKEELEQEIQITALFDQRGETIELLLENNESLRTELSAKDKVLELYASEDMYTVLHLGCSPMVMADRGGQARSILSQYRGDTHE